MDEQRTWVRPGRKKHLCILAAILWFCVMFMACPNTPFTLSVFAEEEAVDNDSDFEKVSTVSGNGAGMEMLTKEETSKDISRVGEQAVWQGTDGQLHDGSFQDAVENVCSGGTIALLTDVSVEGTTVISKNISITSYDSDRICTIKNITPDIADRSEVGRIFTVNGAELRLSNIVLDGGRNEGVVGYHPLICVNSVEEGKQLWLGVVRLLPGAVLQNAENADESVSGGAINIRQGQVLMYEGAVITHCKAKDGGGIEINSKGTYGQAMFGMAGGSIKECEAKRGGGIHVNIGQFQMLGGEISGNRAATGEDNETENTRNGGGGIYIEGGYYAAEAGAMRLVDGRITGNEGCNGGGILLGGARALLQMEGGTVGGTAPEDSNTARNGGGIFVKHGNLKLYGGTVTGNIAQIYGGGILNGPDGLIQLQGAPKVYDNRAGVASDRFDNLYLDGNENVGTDVTQPIVLIGPLTDGVRLGMSRWVRPDGDLHPYWDMIISAKDVPQFSTYTMTETDSARLMQTLDETNKQLYADNMDQYAFIPYDGKIVMIRSVDVALDKEMLVITEPGKTGTLVASVTPENALIKDVIWSSSDETVAKVDEHGVVTAIGKGEAVITVTTVSPYRASDTCTVKVAAYHLTSKGEHGKIIYEPEGPLLEGQTVQLATEPDKGYQLKEDSIKVVKSGEESIEVENNGEAFTMPNYDVVIKAVFEPIVYPITYQLEGGNLQSGDYNPEEYTIESAAITLKNPKKEGYKFKGWTGTELVAATETVTIPAGLTGARVYTAVWEKIQNEKPQPGESGDGEKDENGYGDKETDGTTSGTSTKQIGSNMTYVSVDAQRAETVSDMGTVSIDSLNPQTGNDMQVWYMLAIAAVIGLFLLVVLVCIPVKIRVYNRNLKKSKRKLAQLCAVADIIGVFLFLVLVYSFMKIWVYNRELKENEQELTQLCSVAGVMNTIEGSLGAPEKEKTVGINEEAALHINFAALSERNKDIRGWLICNDRIVNNPVVQANDNSYYLRHSFMNRENRAGCIFMDYRNTSFEDKNVVIYGHNTTDRTMFGSLKDILEDSFWEEKERDRIYLVDTDNCLRVYQIFSCYVVENETYYITTSFESGEAYEDFLRTIKERSQRECSVDVTKEDNILTLSTCYGRAGTKKRLAIHAKEVNRTVH